MDVIFSLLVATKRQRVIPASTPRASSPAHTSFWVCWRPSPQSSLLSIQTQFHHPRTEISLNSTASLLPCWAAALCEEVRVRSSVSLLARPYFKSYKTWSTCWAFHLHSTLQSWV